MFQKLLLQEPSHDEALQDEEEEVRRLQAQHSLTCTSQSLLLHLLLLQEPSDDEALQDEGEGVRRLQVLHCLRM
jgi:hypothetical protein